VAGGAAFDLSLCVKVAPVIAVPALVFYQFGRRKWIAFLAAAGGVLLVAWSPFLFRDPHAVIRDVFGYKSGLGHWGLSYFTYKLSLVSPVGVTLCTLVDKFGSPVLLLAIAALSWWMNRLAKRPSLYSQIGLVFFLFLAATSGFGVQYLAWLVPWAAGLGAAPAALYYATSGAFLFLVYDYWSQGMPWYIADSIRIGDYYFAGLDYFQILCWLSVVALVWMSWKQVRGAGAPGPLARMTPVRRRMALAVAAMLLAVPMGQWLKSRHAAWPSDALRGPAALSAARQRYIEDLSLSLRRMGRTEASAEVAKRASAGGFVGMR
jgi:hypothetical protein